MPPRKQTPAERRRAEEAAEMSEFYNSGVVETEGHAVGEEPAPANDTSAVDAAATQTALAIIPINYSVDDDAIGKLRERAKKVSFKDQEGYEEGRKILATLRALVGLTEKTRKTLKAPVLERGDRIDERANAIKAQLNEIRDMLQSLKDDEDAERARQRRAKEDAEKERVRLEQEAAFAAEREAFAAQQRAFAEEQARQAEERRQFEQQRLELAEAQAKLEADRMAVAEREATEAAEAARIRETLAPQIVEVVERIASTPITQAEIDAAIANDRANMSPGMVDWVSPPEVAGEALAIAEFARQLRAIKAPVISSDIGAALVEQAEGLLKEAIEILEAYEPEAATAAE